jgi:Holliday junction resolvase-like predicted endonuclease
LRQAAEAWLAAHPELGTLSMSFEVVALRGGGLERLKQAF